MNLEMNIIDGSRETPVEFSESRIQAGFPSPAQSDYTSKIDLNRELIENPASTFCARVTGNSMVDAGINDGDLLIIDKSLPPRDGSIAVCFLDGDFTVKRISIRQQGVYLVPANKDFPEIFVPQESNFIIWGIVSHIVKNMKK